MAKQKKPTKFYRILKLYRAFIGLLIGIGLILLGYFFKENLGAYFSDIVESIGISIFVASLLAFYIDYLSIKDLTQTLTNQHLMLKEKINNLGLKDYISQSTSNPEISKAFQAFIESIIEDNKIYRKKYIEHTDILNCKEKKYSENYFKIISKRGYHRLGDNPNSLIFSCSTDSLEFAYEIVNTSEFEISWFFVHHEDLRILPEESFILKKIHCFHGNKNGNKGLSSRKIKVNKEKYYLTDRVLNMADWRARKVDASQSWHNDVSQIIYEVNFEDTLSNPKKSNSELFIEFELEILQFKNPGLYVSSPETLTQGYSVTISMEKDFPANSTILYPAGIVSTEDPRFHAATPKSQSVTVDGWVFPRSSILYSWQEKR